ncbi:MAG: alpha/beta hydrolase, partial [Planctomycetota bacterium]
HSMGGHGTWYLGATYPARWAAIAPCAGYPDLLEYRRGFMSRLDDMSEEMRQRFGVTDAMVQRVKTMRDAKSVFDEIVNRGGSPSRTLTLIDNYTQLGVYVLHGENDTVVPTAIARDMRRRLAAFHSDFVYYEYPKGSHWYGSHSVDWPPIFDFFKARSIKPASEIEEFSFSTASPGVSAESHFVTILQQETPFHVSSVDFTRTEDAAEFKTTNARALRIDAAKLELKPEQNLEIDGQAIDVAASPTVIHLQLRNNGWKNTENAPPATEKGPHRNGGFKDAFRNRFVLVYATEGSADENQWYFNRARFDAEKFWYRANGNVELVSDSQFASGDYADRNVVLYGNRDNNAAWELLLEHCPLQVFDGKLTLGDASLSGTGWGAYFIHSRPDSAVASVGVVTATGLDGMKAAYANHYLVNATCFPDVMVFDQHFLSRGIDSLKCAGFWGNAWDVETGDFVWR